jgi:hypothetical protein
MNHRHRLKQLHVLLDRLERLPASPNRDWMLTEVRARAVDVETGVRPGPIRRFESDDATLDTDPSGSKGSRPRGTTPCRKPQGSPARERARVAVAAPFVVVIEAPAKAPPRASVAVSDNRLDLLEHGGELCLGDLPADAPEDGDHTASRPWARGLRG